MDHIGLSDRELLRKIGARLRQRRLDLNWTQAVLAERTGLSRTTIGDIERGAPSGLLTFVQVLRALDALDELSGLLEERGPSPLMLAELQGRSRQRASRRGKRGDE